MAYLTAQEYVNRYGAEEVINLTRDLYKAGQGITPESLKAYLADPVANQPSADMLAVVGALNAAIADAEAYAYSYLSAEYVNGIPFTAQTVPAPLLAKVADVARYYLHKKNPVGVVRERFEDAKEWLRDVAKGLISLGLNGASQITAGNTGPAIVTREELPSRVFTPYSQERFTGGY